MLEIERILCVVASKQNNPDFVTVRGDNFRFHEGQSRFKDLVNIARAIWVVRVWLKHWVPAIDEENNWVFLVFQQIGFILVHTSKHKNVVSALIFTSFVAACFCV